MSAGRRCLFLCAAFLVPALWLATGRTAHAQPGGFRPADPGAGRHAIWQYELRPDQIRKVLGDFGQDDGKNDWFEKMLFDAVKEKNKNLNLDDEQVKSVIKRMMADKQFMDRVTDLAQKQKNQTKNTGDVPPKLTPEDLAKLAKLRPEGDPFKIPEGGFDPERLPFHPKNPLFDPEKFPHIDRKNPPQFDPNTTFPLDPKNGRPFDPRTGEPIDPQNPPRIDPVDPKGIGRVGPGAPPKDVAIPPKVDPAVPPPPPVDPMPERPADQPPPPGRVFDPENPLGNPKDTPDKIARTKAAEAATALWEKNVGPIEDSPAVQRAIIDLVSDNEAMEALTDAKGNNFFDLLQNETGDGEKLGDWFGGGNDSGWEWPKLDLGWGGRNRDFDFDVGGGRSRDTSSRSWGRSSPSSSGGSGFSGGPSFNFGGMTVPWVLVLVLLALIVAAVLWWKWSDLVGPRSAVAFAGGPGPWPIDPRSINTREDVVKAFEYLSVLICGPGAKTWTHSTIADELTALAVSHGETAVKLARLYELARYAPLDEPLTRAELLEARRLACDLAGLDE